MRSRWIPIAVLVAVLGASALADEGGETKPAYEPKTLEPSLRDQALAALGERALEKAADLYRRWLAADPRDANSWYNLACVLCLKGEREAGLTAFETSIDAGFDDLHHAGQDADLASIREDPRFAAAIGRGRAKAAEGALPAMRRHALETTTVGTYVVLLPPDYETSRRRYPVVFVLHGSGSTEIGHARVTKDLGRDGVIYVAPRALHPHTGQFLSGGKAGWTAWPPESVDPAQGDPHPLRLYAAWVLRCADDVAKRYRVDGARVHLWGHSQGAATAVVTACLHPDRVASVFAYAGYYPEELVTAEALAGLKAAGTRMTLCHATGDTVVEPEPTRAMDARLTAAGVEHAVHMVEGTHRLNDAVAALAKAWVDAGARKEEAAGAPGR